MKIIVQDVECSVEIREHDTSPTGLQYKLIVCVPKRLLPNKRRSSVYTLNIPKPKASKPKHNIGAWVIDVGNALSRQLSFKYTYNPSVDKGHGNNTTFTFFFSDAKHARDMGMVFSSDAKYNIALLHELYAAKEHYPAFISPYRRG